MTLERTTAAVSPPARPSTAQQRRFVDEYLIDLNATAAAERAGYSARSAYQLGHRLLKDPRIRAAIAERMKDREQATRIKAYRVLEELAVVSLSSVEHYEIDVEGNVRAAPGAPAGAMRAVSRVRRKTRLIPQKEGTPIVEHDVELTLWDKNPAIANALKHLGLLKDVVEHRDLTLEDLIREAAADPAAGEPPTNDHPDEHRDAAE